MRVSAVIPVYNGADRIERALESVFSQTIPPHEIIVVDDGSTDTTPEVLKKYSKKIRILRQPNRGVSAARNAAIRQATGDWVAFLDADDVWAPRKLEEQARVRAVHPAAGQIFSAYELALSDGAVVPFSSLHRYSAPLLDAGSGVVPDCFFLLFDENFIRTSSLVMRADLLREDLFDERLKTTEDRDLCIRLAAKSDVLFCKETLLTKFSLAGSLGQESLLGVNNREIVQSLNRRRYRSRFADPKWNAVFRRSLAVTKRQRVTHLRRRREYWMTAAAAGEYLSYKFLGINWRRLPACYRRG